MGIQDMLENIDKRKEKRGAYEERLATKGDLKKLRQDMSKTNLKEENKAQARETGKKLVGWVSQGFGNIAQSLNSPDDKRRMRIARMPGRQSQIDIVRKADTHSLKDPSLRYQDIRGRIEKKRRSG